MNDHGSGRRQWLRLIASGALGAAGASGFISRALAKGDIPAASGVYKLEGTARVNGREAREGTPVAPGDRVATGPKSQAVVVVGGDAFLLRGDSSIEIKGKDGVVSELAVAGGKVLSVFSKKPMAIKAATASIGIRGTGCYIEMDPAALYFCLCYGEAQVDGPGMQSRMVKTTHHESPLLFNTSGDMRAEPGPFRNHSDEELVMLESLCGRKPPFMKDGMYPSGKY